MAGQTETRIVHTTDGRELCVESMRDSAGVPTFLLAGTPNCRHLADVWVDDAEGRGLRLIGYDRPGYGGSTAQQGRTVADCAADVRTIADEFAVDRFLIWGFSGGGPHVLACAALLPDRVIAATTVGSPAPFNAPGLDYFAGMGELNVEDMQLYLNDPATAREKARTDWAEYVKISGEELGTAWQTLLSPVDQAVLTGEVADWFANYIHDGLAPGDEGWWDDGVAHMEPWGFDFKSIRVPVSVWHGREDKFVPFQHGEWLAAHIPGVTPVLSETDGHLNLLVDRVGDIHQSLLDHAS